MKYNFTMDKIKMAPQTDMTISRLKRRLLKHVWLVRVGIVGAVLVGLYLLWLIVGWILASSGLTNHTGLLADFLFAPSAKVKSIDNRTNILLLGKAGGDHAAPDLTDTIMFVSITHESPKVTIISIPRDIWIPGIRAKLNSAYYWGNQKQEGGGLLLAKSSVEEIVRLAVAYGVVLDFSAFKSIVDTLEGIEVEVERSFTDEKYPIAGREDDECGQDPEYLCRYETIHFEKGLVKMDGETALKFVRSRNAEGDEGTDLARASRQQKIIIAIKSRVFTPQILLNPKKMIALWQIALGSLETDIEPSAGAILARRVLQADGMTLLTVPEDLLVNPPTSGKFDNLYVFIPKSDDWKEVQSWVNGKLSE